MAEIILAGFPYPVAPVKFKVLKTLAGRLTALDLETAQGLDAYADFIAAAVNAARPEFTRADFDELPLTFSEILAAMPAVAPCVGLSWGKRESAPGEAKAAETATS